MTKNNLLAELESGDMRTIGSSDRIAKLIAFDQEKADQIFDGLESDNPGLRMRAADCLVKAARLNADIIQKYAKGLIDAVGQIDQQEVQWHVAQMIPRLNLNEDQTEDGFKLLEKYFQLSKSNIVRTEALDAMIKLGQQNPSYLKKAQPYLKEANSSPVRSLQARAKKLSKL